MLEDDVRIIKSRRLAWLEFIKRMPNARMTFKVLINRSFAIEHVEDQGKDPAWRKCWRKMIEAKLWGSLMPVLEKFLNDDEIL